MEVLTGGIQMTLNGHIPANVSCPFEAKCLLFSRGCVRMCCKDKEFVCSVAREIEYTELEAEEYRRKHETLA